MYVHQATQIDNWGNRGVRGQDHGTLCSSIYHIHKSDKQWVTRLPLYKWDCHTFFFQLLIQFYFS
jgi:hypothetical protein